jgi:hypothetical protein
MPWTVVIAGLVTLAFALGIRTLNLGWCDAA